MKTNETTILDNTLEGGQVNEKTTSESANAQESVIAAENKDSKWHQVVISGVSGIALGAAGTLFSGAKLPDEMVIGASSEETVESEEQVEDYFETQKKYWLLQKKISKLEEKINNKYFDYYDKQQEENQNR